MIIGFAGKAASGKTTAARHLAEKLKESTHIIPMALLLREEVEQFLRDADASDFVPLVYGCQDDKVREFQLNTAAAQSACPAWDRFRQDHRDIQDETDSSTLTIRRLLQWWGTEYRREKDPDYWTKAWSRKVNEFDLSKEHVLIDDVRFMNELETICAHGGKIVKINRPGFNGAGNHASETSLDDYDAWAATIINDGTLEQFYTKVGTAFEKLS